MRKLAICNHKGGSGKTSIAVNLAHELARMGQKVLLIDIDPQADATARLGVNTFDIDTNEKIPTLYDVLVRKWDSAKTILKVKKNLDLIPGDLDLEGCEIGELANIPNRESLLQRRVISRLHGYDYLIVDTPPSLGFMQLNALMACDRIYIALQTEYSAFAGIRKLFSKVEEIKEEVNPELEIRGIICTMYSRTNHHKAVVDLAKEEFPRLVLDTVIPRTIGVANAELQGKALSEFHPSSPAAKAYKSLAQEVISREENHE